MKDISICIQAGGKSKRMGRDKALLMINSQTLIEYILNQIKDISNEIFIISNSPENYHNFGYPVYEDIMKGIGVLGGLHSALVNSKSEIILMLSCDMPFHSIGLLEYLIAFSIDFDVVIPKLGEGRFEPFRAVYSKRCLLHVESSIKAGERRMISFFDSVNIKEVLEYEINQFGDVSKLFFNINTKDDMEIAREIIRRSS